MNKLKFAILIFPFVIGASIALVIGASIYQAYKADDKPQFAKFDNSKTETGKWIVFHKSNLIRKKGQILLMAVPSGGKTIDGLNAYVTDKEPVIINNDDLVVQKELIHHVFAFSCSRCETIPCPNPVPTPNPNPTPTPNPAPIEADQSWGRARVKAIQGMQKVDTSKVKVCVVDTGTDLSHPNRGNILASQDFTGKGSAQDGNSHGTHTSGTVGGAGGVGISRAGLLICKGLTDQGSGNSSQLSQCLAWCGQQGAQIVSNSWGSPQQDQMINAAIQSLTQKGIAVVVANGNDSGGTLNWPAQLSISNPLVFGIAASDQNDKKASFSTYGPGTKYIAPGVNIISNKPGGGTQAMSGTSMATPHVAGLLTFCIALGKPLQSCLKTDVLNLPSNQQGAGLPRADLTVQ